MNNNHHNKIRLIKRININLKLNIDPLTDRLSTNPHICLHSNKYTSYKVTQIVKLPQINMNILVQFSNIS